MPRASGLLTEAQRTSLAEFNQGDDLQDLKRRVTNLETVLITALAMAVAFGFTVYLCEVLL